MNPLHLLGFRTAQRSARRASLPPLGGVAELATVGRGPRGAVFVEELDGRRLVVTLLAGAAPGQSATFTYANDAGRFRFTAPCVACDADFATFTLPEQIETLQLFRGKQRNALRLDATIPAHYRFVSEGRGWGEWRRASIADISRSGASLIVDREILCGTAVETRVAVSTAPKPMELLADVVRSGPFEGTKKTVLGLRFRGLAPDEDRSIMEFIAKRQSERRTRGLA